jgi:prepilin-type processing-associated H-X9-DG protein
MVIEVPNSGINWLEPRDLSVDQLKQNGLRGLIPSGGSALRPEGFNVLFADGHVETLPTDIDPQKLAPMLEVDPGVGSNK